MAFGFFKKKKKEQPQGSQYHHLKVKEVIQETADAVSLVFEQPKGIKLDYKPGQFLTLIQEINGKKVRRAYSLSSTPFLEENPTVTVKRVEKGVMSNHVNDHIKAGDTIEIMEPMGSFVLEIDPKNARQVFLFGGGSGITPLISIAKSILKVEQSSKVVLVYANQNIDSIIFNDTIESLKEAFSDRFNVINFLESAPSGWSEETGYVTPEKLSDIITKFGDQTLSDKEYMTCGPEPMMNIVTKTWDQLSLPKDKTHQESFVAGTTSPKEIIDLDALPDRTVKIKLEGQEYEYTVPKDKSILEAGLDENIDMPYSCQSGLCTACRGKCVQGSVIMDDDSGLSEEEKQEGYVLLCVARAQTDDVVVEIG